VRRLTAVRVAASPPRYEGLSEPGDGLEPSRRWFRASASTPENPGACRGDGEDSNLATTPLRAVTISRRLVSNEQRLVMALGALPLSYVPKLRASYPRPDSNRQPPPSEGGARVQSGCGDKIRNCQWWRGRGLNPLRVVCKTSLRPDGLPVKTFRRRGRNRTAVGRLSCGCTVRCATRPSCCTRGWIRTCTGCGLSASPLPLGYPGKSNKEERSTAGESNASLLLGRQGPSRSDSGARANWNGQLELPQPLRVGYPVCL
jgi:hypothetical protein